MNCLPFKTKFGWISAFEVKDKIFKFKFGKHKNKSISKNSKKFKISLVNFLNTKNKTIKFNFLIEGNSFQRKVWKELTKIKLGKTKSYTEIAKKFNISPRYVGKTCGQNKIVLTIPYYRVIKSDGSMEGFH
jgi:methylated-DNA-[protein]-cysteine S-methyltransferase|tara:strand:- start:232 stop:624 length:393 start_codon:yes stop_codon:yes gene_type:complete